MKRIKTYLALVLLAATVTVIIQNASAVRVKFLLWEFFVSQALLLPMVLVAGFLLGWIVTSFRRK